MAKTSVKKAPAKRTARATSSGTRKAAGSAKKTAAKTTTSKRAPAKKPPVKKKAAAAKTSAPPRRRGRRPKPDPRLLKVLDMRRDRKSYADIAKQLKYADAGAAFKAFEQAMLMLEVTSIANQRLLERERLEDLASTYWHKASAGDDPEALDQLLKVLDRMLAIPLPLDTREERQLGPVEASTKRETEKLAKHAPALAAAALILARAVDDNASDPKAIDKASRELRISMTQLRGLAGTRIQDEDPDTPKPAQKGVVVPPSRLEELRAEVDSGTGTT